MKKKYYVVDGTFGDFAHLFLDKYKASSFAGGHGEYVKEVTGRFLVKRVDGGKLNSKKKRDFRVVLHKIEEDGSINNDVTYYYFYVGQLEDCLAHIDENFHMDIETMFDVKIDGLKGTLEYDNYVITPAVWTLEVPDTYLF